MCDYSLEAVKNRKATVGDKLVTQRFYSHTTGFVDPSTADTAVCIMPGTEIAFDAPISKLGSYATPLADREVIDTGFTVAKFVQIHRDLAHTSYHKDGLEFVDGSQVLINDLVVGQKASVLQLPAEPLVQHTDLPAMTEQSEPGKTIPVNLEYTD